jgi:xanthine dehydrogenase YagS FAD-binding subunit
VLQPAELITAVILPPPPGGVHVYRKVRDRASYAFALVSVAAIVHRQDGRIAQAQLAFGGIAPRPWRVAPAERALAESGRLSDAADAALAGVRTTHQNTFKVALLRRTLASVLAT